MEHRDITPDQVALRPAAQVMRLARMGSFHQSRLSFMRILLRRLSAERWRFTTPLFDINARGEGTAVYTAHGPDRSYSLVAFAHDLPADQRSDRVIATAWDATFALFDGIPTEADITRLRANVPLQEAGRITAAELSLSRANRSVRLWEHVVSALAGGAQPDAAMITDVGYLMRTTAVYGSGKFGAADRAATCARPEFQAPFQIEMLNVFLIRAFVMDLVEHMARLRAPETAVPLEPALRRRFGIGNSTGLGMAPYLLNHPALLNNWIAARETALARVRALPSATPEDTAAFATLIKRAQIHAEDWRSEHPAQIAKLADLRADLGALETRLTALPLTGAAPWNALWLWAEGALSLEGQEALAALMLEPHGALVDDLSAGMACEEADHWRIDGAMTCDTLRAVVDDIYDWALKTDWSDPATQARVWYVSEAKLEPRLGPRWDEPLAPYEQPLCPGRDAALMRADLEGADGTVAAFLMAHPEHRHIVRRAQIAAKLPYAEIRDNTIGEDMLPIDMLRAKLSFFGACHFDPRSDRWVRITMFQHAPFPSEIAAGGAADDWTYPPLGHA
ncbi:hypothetical protein KUD11_08540 [Roseovarius sp. LXJ103]|uniref:hypothetical protein n=1 Tax=Roseovarius carneus TaxID=2853164 RepID=UPI000D6144EF|nr:hypothetical protein [Roseovarius carneus]MBZ8118695.1 hypothetical protein [Roseovarius carneus]PWE35624.1 hypothetical protein DD563_06420 [Pelagicola sp. LXJ1103]